MSQLSQADRAELEKLLAESGVEVSKQEEKAEETSTEAEELPKKTILTKTIDTPLMHDDNHLTRMVVDGGIGPYERPFEQVLFEATRASETEWEVQLVEEETDYFDAYDMTKALEYMWNHMLDTLDDDGPEGLRDFSHSGMEEEHVHDENCNHDHDHAEEEDDENLSNMSRFTAAVFLNNELQETVMIEDAAGIESAAESILRFYMIFRSDRFPGLVIDDVGSLSENKYEVEVSKLSKVLKAYECEVEKDGKDLGTLKVALSEQIFAMG